MRFSFSTLCPPKWTNFHDLLLILRAYHLCPNRKKAVNSPEVWLPNSAKQYESTQPGLTSPSTVHLQAFATSWRLTPRTALWPYFMPLALAGFTLQSFPLESSIAPSSGLIPPY